MKATDFKTKIYEELAVIAKALANPNRLRIIELLAQGACPVEYIAKHAGLSIANASQHLQTLKGAHLVSTEKRGKYNYYTLANEKVFNTWSALRELGFSQNAEILKLVNDYRSKKSSLESVTSSELRKRLKEGKTLVIDVRPAKEYESGHITDSISMPNDELLKNIDKLSKDKEIVAYCRGPLCAQADDAIEILREKGFQAKRLDEGFPEWEASGLPVEMNGNAAK